LLENSYEGSLYKSVLALTVNSNNDKNLTHASHWAYTWSFRSRFNINCVWIIRTFLSVNNWSESIEWTRRNNISELLANVIGCVNGYKVANVALVRSIVLQKEKDIKPCLKFSSLCQKAGYLNLSNNMFIIRKWRE